MPVFETMVMAMVLCLLDLQGHHLDHHHVLHSTIHLHLTVATRALREQKWICREFQKPR